MPHANARLTFYGRLELVRRVLEDRRPVAHVVQELNCSRATGYKWLARWHAEGPAGLHDRSSAAHTLPGKTAAEIEEAIVRLRMDRKLGPARIGPLVGLAASTVHAVLRRRGLHRLAWLDRPSGQPVRRYERDEPGELLHVDVKKVGRIRSGGGWRTLGRDDPAHAKARHGERVGFEYVHCAVDDHTRLAYAELLPDEKGSTCAAFLLRAAEHLRDLGVPRIQRVLTDNAFAYRHSRAWRDALKQLDATGKFTRPYRPQTNGKAERFNRTLADEWLYIRHFDSSAERAAVLPQWLHTYNHHRNHTALGGQPPISRVNNPAGHYS